MNTKEIQKLIAKRQVEKCHNPVCENLSFFFPFELDVISVSSAGYVYEFEVKISKADFKKDCEKLKKHSLYKALSDQTPNYFSYVCPPGLIKGHQVPSYAGLYYVEGDTITEIIKPPLLHKKKHDLLQLTLKICRLTLERMYIGYSKMTVRNNETKKHNMKILEEAGFSDQEIKIYSKKKIIM